MIRSSKHTISFANLSKQKELLNLISNYRSLVSTIIDYIWSNGYKTFNVSKNKLNCPKFLDSSFLNKFSWEYSERLKQAAGKQVLMMLSAATELRRKQLYMLKKLQRENQNTTTLQRVISLQPLVKPNTSNINLELDSRFIDFRIENQQHFLGFVRLTSIKKGLEIKLPIVKSSVFDKWNSTGTLKKCVRITDSEIHLMFFVKDVEKKTIGKVVGCDQGIADIVTLSDNQTIPKYQGKYNLSDILKILSRRVKGSKGFKRTQEFRKNYINWSINQLNFSKIKEVRLEKLTQVGKGKSKSRFLSHWTYTLINSKLSRVSEEKGFLLKEISNEFRSQRCSKCGWVRKANRKGKTFSCNKCGNALDADLNAASNLLLDLYEIPYWVRLKKINLQGFYWNSDGIYSESYESIVHNA